MKFATTLILLALLLGSVGYIFFYEHATPSTTEIRERSGVVAHFDPAAVETITVRGPADVVALHRGDDGIWTISEPFEDRVDPAWIAEFLEIASDLQIVETIAASEIGESVKLEDTGLGDGRFRVEITPENGDPVQLDIGRATPLKGTTYIREPDKEDIQVVSGDLHPLLSRPPSDLRDQRLLRLDAAELIGFSLKNSRGEIEMERGGAEEFWMLTRPLQTRGHRDFVDDLLARLTHTEIEGLASEENGAARAFEPGRTTVISLTPAGENAQPVTLELSQPTVSEADKVLARVSDRSPVFKVDSDLLALLNRSPNDLRDDHLANIDPDAVSAISVTDLKGYRTMIRRRGKLWVLERNGTYEAANYKAIANFFKAVNDEKIIDFVADSSANLKPYGLDRPALRILLAGFPTAGDEPADDAAVATEGGASGEGAEKPGDTGSSESLEREIVHLRIGVNLEDGKIYANFVGEPFIYRIGDVVLGVAPANPLKWKAMNLLRFSYPNLKNLRVARGTEPPLSVDCNFNLQRFRATSGGKDVTEILDKRRLTNLALTLSGLRASNWVTEDIDDTPELKDPSLVLNLTIDHPVPEGGVKSFPVELTFSPTVTGRRTAYFYGKLESAPEVFVVPYSTYRQLAASLISDPDKPKQPGDFDDGLSNLPIPEPVKPAEPTDPEEPEAPKNPTESPDKVDPAGTPEVPEPGDGAPTPDPPKEETGSVKPDEPVVPAEPEPTDPEPTEPTEPPSAPAPETLPKAF